MHIYTRLTYLTSEHIYTIIWISELSGLEPVYSITWTNISTPSYTKSSFVFYSFRPQKSRKLLCNSNHALLW